MPPEGGFKPRQVSLFQVSQLLRSDKSQTANRNLQGLALRHDKDVSAKGSQLFGHLFCHSEGDVKESRHEGRCRGDRENDESRSRFPAPQRLCKQTAQHILLPPAGEACSTFRPGVGGNDYLVLLNNHFQGNRVTSAGSPNRIEGNRRVAVPAYDLLAVKVVS